MLNISREQIDQIKMQYVEAAKKNGLNAVWLRDIVELHNQGYNHSEIAKRTGVSRETVATYLQRLRSVKTNDYWFLILGAILIGGGIYALYKYFEGSEDMSAKTASRPTENKHDRDKTPQY